MSEHKIAKNNDFELWLIPRHNNNTLMQIQPSQHIEVSISTTLRTAYLPATWDGARLIIPIPGTTPVGKYDLHLAITQEEQPRRLACHYKEAFEITTYGEAPSTAIVEDVILLQPQTSTYQAAAEAATAAVRTLDKRLGTLGDVYVFGRAIPPEAKNQVPGTRYYFADGMVKVNARQPGGGKGATSYNPNHPDTALACYVTIPEGGMELANIYPTMRQQQIKQNTTWVSKSDFNARTASPYFAIVAGEVVCTKAAGTHKDRAYVMSVSNKRGERKKLRYFKNLPNDLCAVKNIRTLKIHAHEIERVYVARRHKVGKMERYFFKKIGAQKSTIKAVRKA